MPLTIKAGSHSTSAVDCRDEDCVALLLAHGADVHKADDVCMTPMRVAVQYKHKKMIEMLKQAGG